MERDQTEAGNLDEKNDGERRQGLIQVYSVNSSVASVQPIVLREEQTVRLLFCPYLVKNSRNSDACVKGTFVYQKKSKLGEWEEVPSINFSSLRTGEGVRLEIESSELLYLHDRIWALYEHYRQFGIQPGEQELCTD